MSPRVPIRPKLVLGLSAPVTAALALAVVLAVGQTSSAEAPLSPPRAIEINCPAPSLGGNMPAMVYLPSGYAGRSRRYPVIYFLHGLPADPDDYAANPFVAKAVAAGGHSAIVVSPQGARAKDSDPEYLDWAPDENWPAAISTDLTKCIDARFRTIADRRGRALIGLSAGGYGAFNIGLRHLDKFAAVEAWSGYFTATDPTGLVPLNLGSRKANRAARVPRGHRLVSKLTHQPTFIAFTSGARTTGSSVRTCCSTRRSQPTRSRICSGSTPASTPLRCGSRGRRCGLGTRSSTSRVRLVETRARCVRTARDSLAAGRVGRHRAATTGGSRDSDSEDRPGPGPEAPKAPPRPY
jgi:enterochelin esterase-like enzyme